VSVATSGTHDTESMAEWWTSAADDERAKVAAVPSARRAAGNRDLLSASYNPDVRDVLIEMLFASASNLVLLPWIDVFGWTDRVNDPASPAAGNWTFRLPWPSERLDEVGEARERQAALRRWVQAYGR
jgi:4-alpha-glucanotransferase